MRRGDKTKQDQLAFQKLIKAQMDKRLKKLEDRPVSNITFCYVINVNLLCCCMKEWLA